MCSGVNLGTVVATAVVAKTNGSGVDTFYTWVYDSYLFDLDGSLWWYK